jgi:hypothetical protein
MSHCGSIKPEPFEIFTDEPIGEMVSEIVINKY